tara:strand:- start:5548 stop:6774 length:1227 start_codon:yes stop_codon:yes gene_type:complete
MTNYIGNKPSDIPLTASDIPDLPTSKITSGTFANSLISSGSVTQHVTSTDLQPVKSDISALALREATNESSASFNLPNQFIDTFATDTLGTKTQCSVSEGYVATNSGSLYVRQNITGLATGGSNIDGTINSDNATAITMTRNAVEGSTSDGTGSYNAFAYTTSSSTGGYVIADLGASYSISQLILGKSRSHGDGRAIKLSYHATETDPHANGTDVNLTNATSTVYSSNTGSTANLSNFTSSGTADWSAISTNGHGVVCKINGFTIFTARYISWKWTSADFHDANAGWTEFDIYKSTFVANATGTAIQNTNTVGSAKTEVGGTFLYKDNSGTATIGTDLKIYFTCDGGSNWTEASSYNAITPVYSTGIKQVRLGKTTCTSGTDVRYKAVWANQASGSKETQLHGIGINY